MTRRAAAAVAGAAVTWFAGATARAQDPSGTPEAAHDGYAPAFSASAIRELGLPEVAVSAGPDGVTAPTALAAGPVLVTLSAPAPWVAYVNVVRPPDGLSEQEATQAALDAAQADLAQPDWGYFGGSITPGDGGSASFVLDLALGEYRWAVSFYSDLPGGEERMRLLPLTVTGEPGEVEVPFDVDLRAGDGLRFTVAPRTVAPGPALWRFSNASANPPAQHHAVLWRVPAGATADQIVAGFGALASGTPAAGPEILARMTWVGFFALQSPGSVTWAEFDLAPGTCAVTSFVVDPATGRPQVLDGMAVVFEVA